MREEIEGRWGSSEEMWRRWEEGKGRRDREEWGSIRGGSSDGFWRREGKRRSGRWASGEGSIGLGFRQGRGWALGQLVQLLGSFSPSLFFRSLPKKQKSKERKGEKINEWTRI